MNHFRNSKVEEVFNKYPDTIKPKILLLRQLIFDTALVLNKEITLEETLKWGEPSYVTKNGSTLRIDWKNSKPNQYSMYFNCKTKLVDTFKELYGDKFKFDSNREIIFDLSETIATEELKHCILMSLDYHNIKHLPLLGA